MFAPYESSMMFYVFSFIPIGGCFASGCLDCLMDNFSAKTG